MSKITDLLKEVGKDVLNEESLKQIETVFTEAVDNKADERAKIATEAALATQDDEKQNNFPKRHGRHCRPPTPAREAFLQHPTGQTGS